MIAIMSTILDAGLPVQERALDAGSVLFRQGDTVRRMHEVCAGSLRLVRHTPGGRPLVLQRAGPGVLLAEASLFAARYQCDAVAESPCAVRSVDRAALLARLRGDPDAVLALTERVCHEVQRLRGRLELMSLPRVADRLDAWLALGGTDGERPWTHVATELGVSPEALYRELARRRRR